MSGIANDADVGRDPLAGEDNSFEIVAAGQSEGAGRGFCRAAAGDEIVLEPQPIVPPAIATPPDHRGGSVEGISEQVACPPGSGGFAKEPPNARRRRWQTNVSGGGSRRSLRRKRSSVCWMGAAC